MDVYLLTYQSIIIFTDVYLLTQADLFYFIYLFLFLTWDIRLKWTCAYYILNLINYDTF